MTPSRWAARDGGPAASVAGLALGVFDVGSNQFRLVTVVRYRDGKFFVRWVMTHRECENWCKLYRKGKA